METRDGRALLRTMSFISSRARALRQRFGASQPSLSDTWTAPADTDPTTDAYLGDDPRLASPDMGGSLLSLLDEPDPGPAWTVPSASVGAGGLEDDDGRIGVGAFRAQRSKSLDSLSAIGQGGLGASSLSPGALMPSGLSSPPGSGGLPISPLLSRPPVSPPAHVHIPRPHAAVSPVSLGRFPDTSIPRIPGPPPSPLKFSTISAPTTPRHMDSYSPLTPRFPESPFVPRITGPSSPKYSRPSTPKLNEPQSPVNIPKIPGPPVSPKHSRPSTPKNLEAGFPELPKPFAPLTSPKVSRPSTPKHLEPIQAEVIIIPRIPGPPPSPKHSRPSTPKNIDKVETLINLDAPPVPSSPKPEETKEGPEAAEGGAAAGPSTSAAAPTPASTGATPRIPSHRMLHRCATLPVRGEYDLPPDEIYIQIPSPLPGPSTSTASTSRAPVAGPSKIEKSPKSPKSPATAHRPSAAPLLEASESGSFDSEENRDTVAEGGLTRPTLFDLRPRPKLKQQWSMDETRAAAQRDLAAAAAMKPAEKRRRFFMRKQTNSAPDSFDGVIGHIPPPKPKEHHSVSFCLGNVRKCRGSDSSIQPPVLPTISK